jgi:asparagine synthase (glutamine-hydrolysing)
MELRSRWSRWQNWTAPGRHPRHPFIHDALVGPEWTMDDQYLQNDVVVAERRDPFLDLRVVEFVLSLPPLPWLFRKHLLRQAFEVDLPKAILERPKKPLGLLHESLLDGSGDAWWERWVPHPKLATYVDLAKTLPLSGEGRSEVATYVALRPLILDRWLVSMAV